jgi:hypothetical protein
MSSQHPYVGIAKLKISQSQYPYSLHGSEQHLSLQEYCHDKHASGGVQIFLKLGINCIDLNASISIGASISNRSAGA